MRRILLVSMVIFSMMSMLLEAFGATWYVDDDGADLSINGQSQWNPLRTITYALENKANNGDTILLMPGDYANEGIKTPSSGVHT